MRVIADIARQLGRSYSTVNAYVHKLGIETFDGAINDDAAELLVLAVNESPRHKRVGGAAKVEAQPLSDWAQFEQLARQLGHLCAKLGIELTIEFEKDSAVPKVEWHQERAGRVEL